MRKPWNWLLSTVLSLALVLGLASGAAAEGNTEQGVKHLTILHTNDMHARSIENGAEMGFAKVAGIFDSYRKANPNTLVLDAGDAIHGTTFATLVGGQSVADVMNLMGYDAMAPGNHEFNYGTDRLLELAKGLKFPVISGNVRDKQNDQIFKPYIIKEIDGIKVGIFGLSTPETAYKTHPINVEKITFTDPVKEAQSIVDELQDQTDLIIALGHLGMDKSSEDNSFKVVKAVKGIDLFVDGHSHTLLEKGLLSDNDTLIVSTGEYTQHVGVVDIWLQDGKITKREAKLINQEDSANITPNESVTAKVAEIIKAQEVILAEKVGNTSVALEGAREKVRASETNLGNLIADALLFVTKADVALTNGGGIRASIDQGVITKGEVITVLPFGNQIVTLKVKGADIKSALENGVSDYPNAKGAFPQVGGMSFKIDPAAAPGSRVHDLKVGSKAIDLQAEYTIATNDFLAAGGDEYTMFGQYPQAGMYGSLDEALIAYIQELGSADPKVEGRIKEYAAPGTATPQPEPKPNPEPKPEPKPESNPEVQPVYIVKKGDTLWGIARKHGTTWQALRDLNHLKNPNLIFPGQKIILPAKA
ncbi:LysM peptidoglycan-binding domain-containing protein [Paenibacillus sp. 1011MAR3C5]|uniref:5'-nucleotidase C-terminal domain-containing protein n=1 Tax=Paenibacillus sp. 1011MAR3C5 TaxID=1675787 RepID=UPI000E6C2090|nr:5'-nucleotidase C-terminal domain-containing protein [Paenibacillus sp. 1011MAR3C5]RJE84305.1 LysM peptidoglycan-binding domain-containing protein [Paenibacillus sp. 1011MAR3C5]